MFKHCNHKKVQILGIVVLTLVIFSFNIHYAKAGSFYLAEGNKWVYDNTIGSYGGYVKKCVVKFDWSWRRGWGEKRNEDGCKFRGQIVKRALNQCSLGQKYIRCSSDGKSVIKEVCKNNGWWSGMTQTKDLLNVWDTEEERCKPGYTCKLFDNYAECVKEPTATSSKRGQWCERCSNNIACTKVKWYDPDGGCDDNWYNQRTTRIDNSCTNLCLQGQTCQNGGCITISSISGQSFSPQSPLSFQGFSSTQSFHSVQPSQPFRSVFHSSQPFRVFRPLRTFFSSPLTNRPIFR